MLIHRLRRITNKKRRLIVLVAISAVTTAFLVKVALFSSDYGMHYYIKDSTLSVDENDSDILTCNDNDNRACLAILRESRSSSFTDSDLSESVIIDIPAIHSPQRLDLRSFNIQVGFIASRAFGIKWAISQDGVDGYVDVYSVSNKSIKIQYHIVVHAYIESNNFDYTRRDFVFSGRADFSMINRVDIKKTGVIWPDLQQK